MARDRRKRTGRRFPTLLLLVSALGLVLSLGSVVGAYAMPVEARTAQPWYAYRASVGFDFTAHVKQGKFYGSTTIKPEDLMKIPGPTQPPVFRRVLISQFTDSIEVRVPYSFKADRPAPIQAKWRVDGTLMLPGIWQQPYPLLAQKEINVEGAEIAGVETFVIPVSEFFKDIERNRVQYNLAAEPFELHIKPVLDVEVAGLKEPVTMADAGEFVISVHSGTMEIDDPRELNQEKSFAETLIVPITVPLFGSKVTVALIRQVSVIALAVCVIVAAGLAFGRRKKPDPKTLLQRLGPSLISARAIELPGDIATVDVRTAKELLQLHAQTERPVVRVGNTYYLQDGTTCYRLELTDDMKDPE